jgi:carboxyl-terminal processing protease
VRLRVERPSRDQDLVLLRGPLRPPAASVRRFDKDSVIVQISHFTEPVVPVMNAGLAQLGELSPHVGIVLDLRGNPGGLVTEAAALVDRFVGEGVVVTTRIRDTGETALQASLQKDDLKNPLVVLMDRDTASAAEIVAGALHDLGRARLVGEHTYGKGSVQRIFAYEDGSALKLTVGRYYLPNGETIDDERGLVPDREVTGPAGLEAREAGLNAATHDPMLAAALWELGAPNARTP